MGPQLRIQQHRNWRLTQCPGPSVSYRRDDDSDSWLQYSYRRYVGSKGLDVTPEKLIRMAEQLISKAAGIRERTSGSGQCAFGTYGSAAARADSPPYIRAWVIWNGDKEVILATHISGITPDPQHIEEATGIALAVDYW